MALNLAGQAIALADRGWHVFPLAPGAKVPRRGSAGQKDSTCDVSQVIEWWTDEPTANIGIHCSPSGLLVVDLDRHGEADGVLEWQRLIRHYGRADTLTVATPRDGFHLYYREPMPVIASGSRNTAGLVAPGIDTRSNGYVLAPPSTVDGRPYVTARRAPVADPPAWLIDRLISNRGSAGGPRGGQPARPQFETKPTQGGDIDRRLTELAAELAATPSGKGNHAAARLAFLAGQYVGAGQCSTGRAYGALVEAISSWSWRRSGDERTMRDTIARQIDAGARSPRIWR